MPLISKVWWWCRSEERREKWRCEWCMREYGVVRMSECSVASSVSGGDDASR